MYFVSIQVFIDFSKEHNLSFTNRKEHFSNNNCIEMCEQSSIHRIISAIIWPFLVDVSRALTRKFITKYDEILYAVFVPFESCPCIH